MGGSLGVVEQIAGDRAPEWWRNRPVLLRSQVAPLATAREMFATWCKEPVVARLYVLTEEVKRGSAKAVRIPDLTLIPRLYEQAAGKGEQLTVLLNGVEKVSATVSALRNSLPYGPDWRADDIVTTLSSAGSGIGFHAGHEDGYIVQLWGSRRWRVWSSKTLSDEYRWFLLGRGSDEYAVVPDRPDTPPLIDETVNAGDALYIPAMFPHEGVTIEESVSASVAWRGFGPYSLLRRYAGTEIAEPLDREAAAKPERYFALLPDPSTPTDVADFLARLVADAVDLADLGLSRDELSRRLARQLESAGHI